MLFRNIFCVLPAIFSVGSAAVIPASRSTFAPNEVVKRCNTCGTGTPGSGSGIGVGVSTMTDVDLSIRGLTKAQLEYTALVAGIFSKTEVATHETVGVVLSIGSHLCSWTDANLVALSADLTAYIAGTAAATTDLCIKAGIDVISFTTVEAVLLQTFIHTVLAANVALATEVKTDLILWVNNAIVVANCEVVSLQSKINATIVTLTSVVASLHLDIAVATCASAAAALKIAIRAYIAASLKTCTGLLAALVKVPLTGLLAIVDAWISEDVSGCIAVAQALLGINLKLVSDATVCKTIVAYLLKLSGSFDVLTSIGVNASACYSIFSSIVA